MGQGSSSFSYKTENADWSGAFRNWKQWSVVECKKWILINASKDSAATKEWVSSLQKVAPSLGMKLSGPKQTEIPDNRTGTYVQALDKAIAMKPQIIMIIIPNNKGKNLTLCIVPVAIQKIRPSLYVIR